MNRERINQQISRVVTRLHAGRDRARKAVRREAPGVVREIGSAFADERYFGPTGRSRKVRTFGWAWFHRKARLGLDLRRGHATGALQRVMQSKRAIVDTQRGFNLDFLIPAATTVATMPRIRKVRRGRPIAPRRVSVASYIEHFADDKAPTLGSVSERSIRRLTAVAHKATERHMGNDLRLLLDLFLRRQRL